MGFSKKIQEYFDRRGLTNREVSKIMGGYNESMISKYINSDKLSSNFIELLVKHFPDIDFNYLLKEDDVLENQEKSIEKYEHESFKIIEEIESKIEELKTNMARKCHE